MYGTEGMDNGYVQSYCYYWHLALLALEPLMKFLAYDSRIRASDKVVGTGVFAYDGWIRASNKVVGTGVWRMMV